MLPPNRRTGSLSSAANSNPRQRDFRQLEWDDSLIDDCRHLVELAVREDLNRRLDITTAALIEREATGTAAIVARQPGVLAGMKGVATAIEVFDADITLEDARADGSRFQSNETLGRLRGSARDLLTTERILLNLLGKLTGIATRTDAFVQLIAGTTAGIYDTRKTTPGWRHLEKYAVRCGGGRNHRTGLYDGVLIKDNHLAIVGGSMSLGEAVSRARRFVEETLKEDASSVLVEIEIDAIRQVDEALAAEPDIILLDNLLPSEVFRVVRRRNEVNPKIELEVSGCVSLDNVRDYATTGVERISSGSLTHSAAWLDVGLDWEL